MDCTDSTDLHWFYLQSFSPRIILILRIYADFLILFYEFIFINSTFLEYRLNYCNAFKNIKIGENL